MTNLETKFQKSKLFLNIGLGINVNESLEDFPSDIQNKVSSIKIILGKPVQRELLLAYILNSIEKLFNHMDSPNLVDTYNNKCINVNNEVSFQLNNKLEKGVFKKINNNGESIILFNEKNIAYNGVIINL